MTSNADFQLISLWESPCCESGQAGAGFLFSLLSWAGVFKEQSELAVLCQIVIAALVVSGLMSFLSFFPARRRNPVFLLSPS